MSNRLIKENSPYTFFKLTSTDYFSFQITLEKIESLYGLRFERMKDNEYFYYVTDLDKYAEYKSKINK